jgi:hypothetical protein
MLRIFEFTKDALGTDLEKFIKKRADHESGVLPSDTSYNDKELKEVYAGYSIFEFATIALTEPAFQRRMAEIEYKGSKETLLHRFFSAVSNLLVLAGARVKENSVAFEALSAIMDFTDIEAQNADQGTLLMHSYPGQNRYSSKEFRDAQTTGMFSIIDKGTQQLEDRITRAELARTEENLKKISTIFTDNTELGQIGSEEQYSRFLALTNRYEIELDIEGFKNYIKGISGETLDNLPGC